MKGIKEEKSPYHGAWLICLILVLIPISIFALVLFIAMSYEGKENLELNIWTAIFFGSFIGSCFTVSTIISGIYKGMIKNMINRIIHFISNWKISFKLAWMLYKEEVVEQGLLFWIYGPFIGANFGTLIASFLVLVDMLF